MRGRTTLNIDEGSHDPHRRHTPGGLLLLLAQSNILHHPNNLVSIPKLALYAAETHAVSSPIATRIDAGGRVPQDLGVEGSQGLHEDTLRREGQNGHFCECKIAPSAEKRVSVMSYDSAVDFSKPFLVVRLVLSGHSRGFTRVVRLGDPLHFWNVTIRRKRGAQTDGGTPPAREMWQAVYVLVFDSEPIK
ncbi:hypothetical protein AAG570_005857 [Ranatra chinensis]|uniref:Uncharacterized protein n=1 Tax=Ranatra chinensis TaxID=642074 RepID=A0ABD0XWC6_9HEMI